MVCEWQVSEVNATLRLLDATAVQFCAMLGARVLVAQQVCTAGVDDSMIGMRFGVVVGQWSL